MTIRAMYTASTGLEAMQTGVDVIANNLANVNTTGFKRQRADFEDLLYFQLRRAGTKDNNNNVVPVPIEVGHGVKLSGTPRFHGQGSLRPSENAFDLAIQGQGFFQVTVDDELAPGGVAYTRAGNFTTDNEGNLVNQDGYKVVNNITVPDGATDFAVSRDGTVSALVGGAITELGQLKLTTFINPTGLDSIGDNLFAATEGSGDPENGIAGDPGIGLVLQNFLEESNVQVVRELVDLILTQRAYEVNFQTIEKADQMLRQANQLGR